MLLPVAHTSGHKIKTMKWKKFDNTNIENLVNNDRTLKHILQNNNISIMKFLRIQKPKTMELKKFNNINTENHVNNNRNVPDIIKDIW